jgi:hypothetical protein
MASLEGRTPGEMFNVESADERQYSRVKFNALLQVGTLRALTIAINIAALLAVRFCVVTDGACVAFG